MRFAHLLPWLLLLPAAPLTAQLAPGYLVSVTEDVAVVGLTSPPITLTATVAPTTNAPLSSLDGMMVNFGGRLVPVKNGTASAKIPYDTEHPGGYELEVDFPSNYSPVDGGSFKIVDVAQRYQPLPTALSGEYVFVVKSYTGNGTARGGEGVSIGVLNFSFSNQGLPIVSGELDYTGALGTFHALPVTGTYSIDGNGVAGITITSSAGTQHFSLAIEVEQLTFLNKITQASLVETDTPLLAGAGMLYARGVFNRPATSAPPLKTDLSGALFQLAGESYFGGSFPLPVSLTENSQGSVLPPTVALVSGAYVQRNVPVTFSDASQPDAFGRFTFTLTVPNGPTQLPTDYAAYGIDNARVLLLSTDPVASKVLLSGEADVPVDQQSQ